MSCETVRQSPAITTPVRAWVATREYDSARIIRTTNNIKALESVTLQNHGFCSYTREMEGIREWHFLCPDGHQLLDSQSHGPSGSFRTQTGRFRIKLPRLVMQKDKLDRRRLCSDQQLTIRSDSKMLWINDLNQWKNYSSSNIVTYD